MCLRALTKAWLLDETFTTSRLGNRTTRCSPLPVDVEGTAEDSAERSCWEPKHIPGLSNFGRRGGFTGPRGPMLCP